MEVKLFSKNIEVSDYLDQEVMDKVGKLDRYLEDIEEARVDIASTNARSDDEREVVQITVRGKGFILRAEERAGDVVAALNLALNTIKRRIKRYKGKRNDRWKRGPDLPEITDYAGDDLEKPVIARRKQFVLRPMDEWEALEQMELLGHTNFFVFYNVQTETINVLYKRHDDTYGLIQPDVP